MTARITLASAVEEADDAIIERLNRSILARYCWEAVALYRAGTDPSLR